MKGRTERSWQAMQNNAQGHFLEGYIKGACDLYKARGVAVVEQIPEPFRTTKTGRDGTFTGRFLSAAQPDFMGTLRGGRSICFEAKYTRTDRILQSVLTEEQRDSLERHWAMGAVAGVCVGIGDVFGLVPWSVCSTTPAGGRQQSEKKRKRKGRRLRCVASKAFPGGQKMEGIANGRKNSNGKGTGSKDTDILPEY